MKKILSLIIIVALVVGGFAVMQGKGVTAADFISYAPCRNPVGYKIGSIDNRFRLSEQELLTHIQEAEQSWEQESGRDLFAYDPNAALTINLVYDKRQDLNNQINDLRSEVEKEQDSLKPDITAYEERSVNFQERAKALNDQVAYWNERGGAPSEEYEKLVAEQKVLQQEADALNAEAKRLNISSDTFAAKVDQLNQTVTTFNSELEVRPEEGLYDPNTNTISIYFHNTKTELVHTLAHELGHARGIGHIASENAIMYAQVNDQITPTTNDIAALEEVCRTRSFVEVAQERIKLLMQLYKNR